MADVAPHATVTLMLQDESLSGDGGLTERRELPLDREVYDRFLDGPTSRRIGIVDFDPDTGAALAPPARYTPSSNPKQDDYDADPNKPASPAFLATNAYGTVFDTIRMFEEPEALGRKVTWAFPGEQLLVVPRAGEWANAVYDRATRSLQFYWFESDKLGRIYTALSRDIVAHESGHALLDAVVPSLHDGSTPESLAIHEAIADLVAVLMSLRSSPLRIRVLATTDNDISNATAFSSIAERFGQAQLSPNEMPRQALRMLLNDNTMSTVDKTDPHPLSTVMSGLFYQTLVDVFETGKANNIADGMAVGPAAGKSLGSAAVIFRKLLLRGIDYLPPGELTFADIGRATIAADAAADPGNDAFATIRQLFAQRFVDREIVTSIDQLAVETPAGLAIAPDRLPDIRDSDWAAYSFVDEHREDFAIPKDTNFVVLPRVDATKKLGTRTNPDTGQREDILQRELILKVYWDTTEPNNVPGVPASQRRVKTGATLALLWSDGHVLALVRSSVTDPAQGAAREQFLTRMMASDTPVTVVDAEGGDGHGAAADPRSGVEVRVIDDAARITGTQRLLHIQSMDPQPSPPVKKVP